jgi:hypothetical protein
MCTNPPGVLIEGGTEKGHETTVDITEACNRLWYGAYKLQINYGIGYRICNITRHVTEILRYN